MKKLPIIALGICVIFTGCTQVYPAPNPAPDKQRAIRLTPAGETPQETIEQLFDRLYQAYAELQIPQIDYLLEPDNAQNRGEQLWLETLTMRRKLISKNRFCYVETGHYPYTIHFDTAALDERMEYWAEEGISGPENTVLHFTITGENGRVYPPFFAVNAQQTAVLKHAENGWVLTFHYFPGTNRNYGADINIRAPSETEMLSELQQEFCKPAVSLPFASDPSPENSVLYCGKQAARYANEYMETPNPAFYRISDWMGNCSNFVSQCIWYGFYSGGQRNQKQQVCMDPFWYAGSGGGSPAWENVNRFWEYAVQTKDFGLHGETVPSVLRLNSGGILQICPKGMAAQGYSHSLLLVDRYRLLFAQNTPGCLVSYADLANMEMRYLNPIYFLFST